MTLKTINMMISIKFVLLGFKRTYIKKKKMKNNDSTVPTKNNTNFSVLF